MFDMREDVEADPCTLAQMMQDLGVFISVKPKVKQTSKVQFYPLAFATFSVAAFPLQRKCNFDVLLGNKPHLFKFNFNLTLESVCDYFFQTH